MNNRLGNVRNKYQTEVRKVLCLCSAGLLRSPTAANVLHQEYGYNTRAAGVSPEYALIPVDKVLLEWADEIVCVEGSVYNKLVGFIADEITADRVDPTDGKEYMAKVVTLSVPDMYEWNTPKLREIIRVQYEEIGGGNPLKVR